MNQNEVQAAVKDLLDAISRGQSSEVNAALERLGAPQENSLYQQVGRMTRSLHDSLAEFKQSLNRSNLTMSTTNLPDAQEKLEAVITATHKAAHHTLEASEEQCEVISGRTSRIQQIRELLSEPDETTNAMIAAFLVEEERALAKIGELSTKIMVAQEFQDLTSQAIRKVIKLVTSLETNMLALLKVFGHHDEPDKSVPEAAEPDTRGRGAVSQDDVDSMLKDFGF